MDKFGNYRKFNQYVIAGGGLLIYSTVVLAHPEHAGDPPPLSPTAPQVAPEVMVASSMIEVPYKYTLAR